MSEPAARARKLLRRATGAVADKLLKVDAPQHDYEIERDIPTTMPDGVVLLADRYYPTDASGPLPVVLVRTPYGRRGLLSSLLLGPLARARIPSICAKYAWHVWLRGAVPTVPDRA